MQTIATTLCVLLTSSIFTSVDALRGRQENINGNSSNNQQHRQSRRHLLQAGTECVTYLKLTDWEDGTDEESWSCEFSQEDAAKFGAIDTMMDIEGVDYEELAAMGAVSGGSVLKLDGLAYVEEHFDGSHQASTLHVSEAVVLEDMDWEHDERHYKNRQLKRQQQQNSRNLAPTTGTLNVLVVRVIDGDGVEPTNDVKTMEEDVFLDSVCLKSQYEACSYGAVTVQQAQEASTILEDGTEVKGVVNLQIEQVASSLDYKAMESQAVEATAVAFPNYRSDYDLVMYCQPPGSGSWLAYAYVNSWRSFYNDKWCGYVSTQMHEVGHNLGLAHSGKEGESEYADKSGMMGFSYRSDNTPKQCFNAAKSYQLGWYPEQTATIYPLLELPDGPQEFVLNGVSDYQPDGSNGDALVTLRLAYEGHKKEGKEWYIGYNRKAGVNIETFDNPNMVHLVEKINTYGDRYGHNFYGKSFLLEALDAGESKSFMVGETEITLTVNSIDGKDAKITLSSGTQPPTSAPEPTSAPKPTRMPTLPPALPPSRPPSADCAWTQLELQTDERGEDIGWTIRDEYNRGYRGSKNFQYDNNKKHIFTMCLSKDATYRVQMEDKGQDGLCCNNGKGYYRVIVNGVPMVSGSQWDGPLEEKTFLTGPAPTTAPTPLPTGATPTESPVVPITDTPTEYPTDDPTFDPTSGQPTDDPTYEPSTASPTDAHSTTPTVAHSESPTTPSPTGSPTESPTVSPTDSPTVTHSDAPSASPTNFPTESPTAFPSASPTIAHSDSPSATPTKAPTESPTKSPTLPPTKSPTVSPTKIATAVPTSSPIASTPETALPTESEPRFSPTVEPTVLTTDAPTMDCSDVEGKFGIKSRKKVQQKDCKFISKKNETKQRKWCKKNLDGGGKVWDVCKMTCGMVGSGTCTHLQPAATAATQQRRKHKKLIQ